MLVVLVAVGAVAAATPVPQTTPRVDEYVIPADDWARPRSGARVAALPALRAAVATWRAEGGVGRLEVIHPGGEAGTMWGAEVRDWLVALGIPPDRIVVQSGSARPDVLIMRFATR